MLNFNDWSKKDKEDNGYTLTKSSSGLPLFVLDDPLPKEEEPIENDPVSKPKTSTIPHLVADFISSHNN
jgi:hypothetical protein